MLPISITQDVHSRFLFTSGAAEVGEREQVLYKAFLAGMLGCPKTTVKSLAGHAAWYNNFATAARARFPTVTAADAVDFLARRRIPAKHLFKFWAILEVLSRYEGRKPGQTLHSTVSIALDCSNSGAQLIAGLLSDKCLLTTTNVIAPRKDLASEGLDYDVSINDLYENLRADIQNVMHTAVTKKHQRLQTEDAEMQHIARGFILSPQFSRTFVKRITVPTLYGQGQNGTVELIAAMLRDSYRDNTFLQAQGTAQEIDFSALRKQDVKAVAARIADIYRGVLKKRYPSIGRFFKIATFVAKCAARVRKAEGLRWTTADNSVVNFFPVKCCVRRFRYNSAGRSYVASIRVPVGDNSTQRPLVDERNLVRGFAANFVHTMDGAISRGVVTAGGQRGLTFSAVHDSWMLHPAHADFLQKTFHREYRRAVFHAREQLVMMYNKAKAERPRKEAQTCTKEVTTFTFPPAVNWRRTRPGLAIFI